MRAALTLVLLTAAACNRPESARFRDDRSPAGSGASAPIRIHESPKLTSIEVPNKMDNLGRTLRVACVTCHSVRKPPEGARFPERGADLSEFHVGLAFQHGTLRCTSCHVERVGGAPKLHLADGTEVPTSEAMRLCAQCHGRKFAQYERGVHGGMNGHWDLSLGGRFRNHCVDCHDPHVPAFQPSRPVLPPRDRGALQLIAGGGHDG